MAPILVSRVVPVRYAALEIKSLPSLGHELSFGISLTNVCRDGCKVFSV